MIQHKGTNSIETVRLFLRKFVEQDSDDMFYNWASDPEVCTFLSWGPHSSVDVTRKKVNNWVMGYDEKYYNWAIVDKKKDMVIGSISVEIQNDKDFSCEVGYCLSRSYWSQGIMTEALHAVMHYLFYEIGYQKIIAKHDVNNPASGRVMQKVGMQFVKIQYQASRRKDGSFCDVAVYIKQKYNL